MQRNELADTAEFYCEEIKQLRSKYDPGSITQFTDWHQQRKSKLAQLEALNAELERMVANLEEDRRRTAYKLQSTDASRCAKKDTCRYVSTPGCHWVLNRPNAEGDILQGSQQWRSTAAGWFNWISSRRQWEADIYKRFGCTSHCTGCVSCDAFQPLDSDYSCLALQ